MLHVYVARAQIKYTLDINLKASKSGSDLEIFQMSIQVHVLTVCPFLCPLLAALQKGGQFEEEIRQG